MATRITVDTSALKSFADRVMSTPDTRREMGLAIMRSVTEYERNLRGESAESNDGDIGEDDWYRLRGRFASPEQIEGR